MAELARTQPVLPELPQPKVFADRAEGVHIGFAGALPAHELNTQLDGALRRAKKSVFVEAHHGVIGTNRRNGRLADTDNADVVRLY